MSMSPKDVFLAVVKAAWPLPDSVPTAGGMAGNALANPLSNINILADAVDTAALVAASTGDPAIPIATLDITVSGVGVETIIGRHVSDE